jgi:hypothetical protein
MATITYGSEDAIYGSGVYDLAVYGEFGPTLSIEGFSATTAVGNLDTSAEANTTPAGVFATGAVGSLVVDITEVLVGVEATSTLGSVQVNISEILTGVQATGSVGSFTFTTEVNLTLTGVQATALEGVVQPSGGATKSLTGVSGTSAIGTVVITATTGLTGQQLNGSVGLLQVNITENITGVFATSNFGDTEESGKANHTPTSIELTGASGNTSETGVVFDFESVKETYGRKRTVILSRAA